MFEKYRLNDVLVKRDALVLGHTPEPWGNITDVGVRPLATGRSLPWAIVRIVPASLLLFFGLDTLFWAITTEGPVNYPYALGIGGLLTLFGVLSGRRPAATCWGYGRYALLIAVADQPRPIIIRPSRNRSAVEGKARNIHARLRRPPRPFVGMQFIYVEGDGVTIGDRNKQYNWF